MNKISDQITIDSSTQFLSEVRKFISSFASNNGISEIILRNVMLAVDEACANVIEHGYNSISGNNLTISLSLEDEKLTVRITDNGISFNPENVPQPDINRYYNEHKKGGWGLFLIRKIMDIVDYHKSEDGKNILTLVKKIK